MEQRVLLLDETLIKRQHERDLHQKLYAHTDSLLLRLLLQGKLRRAELEVTLFRRAIDRAMDFQASHSQHEGEVLWFLVFFC
jgi:hypothetical protein